MYMSMGIQSSVWIFAMALSSLIDFGGLIGGGGGGGGAILIQGNSKKTGIE